MRNVAKDWEEMPTHVSLHRRRVPRVPLNGTTERRVSCASNEDISCVYIFSVSSLIKRMLSIFLISLAAAQWIVGLCHIYFPLFAVLHGTQPGLDIAWSFLWCCVISSASKSCSNKAWFLPNQRMVPFLCNWHSGATGDDARCGTLCL